MEAPGNETETIPLVDDPEQSDGQGGAAAIGTVGSEVDEITVQIGPQFLELFSEHLYSSPNKAFEELVSNSWDAGATTVYIGMSGDLSSDDAAAWVLDNGVSMDAAGLEALWAVATSQKRDGNGQSKRPQIGKFGIGKLATYILADCLTYVCKASDGVVRAVTMDYRRIQRTPGALHIDPLPLKVRELDPAALTALLQTFAAGSDIAALISRDVPPPEGNADYENEFGGTDVEVDTSSDTWTLAILTSLKTAGKEMQPGHIKRMLRYALPLGASLQIAFNGDSLDSVKVDTDVDQEWVLGPGIGITSLVLDDDATGEDDDKEKRTVVVRGEEDEQLGPVLHIEGIDGPISGRVRLYADRISGGKSEALGSSNGFFVNVLGRVVNTDDPYFGLENLNHSAWAKFRATVRADGLDPALAVNREGLLESDALHIFRKLLGALFNKARNAHDASVRASWPDVGQVLTETWGTVPLQALRRVVAEGLRGDRDLPGFIDASGVDAEAVADRLEESAPEQVADFVSDVVLEDLDSSEPFVKYEVASSRVVVNGQHPFSVEHGETHEQQLLLRDAALVDLLTQAHMADLGIQGDVLWEVAEYRDQTLRLIAQRRRRTGVQLAALLVDATRYDKGLERIVGDALEYLGFKVRRLGQAGKTEGVATAPAESTDPEQAGVYSFTYDAKSAERRKVKTGNVNVAGLVRHRSDENADHTLVVAPDYESGALEEECKCSKVTPMRAKDLARLLLLVATRGPIDLRAFRSLFANYSPDDVASWVDAFSASASERRVLRYDELLAALERVGLSGPDAITLSVLAREIRELTGDDHFPTRADVRAVVAGLEVLLTNLVRLSGDNLYIGTTPTKLREAIRDQLRVMPEEYRPDVEEPSPADGAGAG